MLRPLQNNILFLKAFSACPCPMAISSPDEGIYIEINEAFSEIIGYSRSEVIGAASSDLNIWVNKADRDAIIALLTKNGSLRNFETLVRTKADSVLSVKFNAEYVTVYGYPLVLSVMTDITAKKQLDNEILRLENLNLVGQMAAGISHEVRNPMTTVRGYLQLLSSKPDCKKYAAIYELLISEIDRANSIITEFLSIAKNETNKYYLKSANINSILLRIRPLIEAHVNEFSCTLTYELNHVPELLLNENEIRQLILNLVRNGVEAMPSGGSLTIKTYTEGDAVMLAVKDTGCGIDDSILSKIGTPFFTTKKSGTGLGLSVCYGIARRHNGIIKISTGPDGTTFTTRFPLGLNIYP